MLSRNIFIYCALGLAFMFNAGKVNGQCFTTSTPTNNCTYGDVISAFTLNSISATGISGCSPSGYGSFSTPVWTLTAGTTYSWSATVGSGLYYQSIGIWIDINNDGIYQSTEMLVTTGAALTHSSTITIPSTGVVTANNVRMRVRCAYSGTMGTLMWGTGTTVCNNSVGSYGETQDFYVNLVAPCVNPTVPTLSATSTTICNGGSTTLSIATGTLNDATTWSWYTGSCGGTAAGTGSTLSVSPTTTTTYYARGTGGCVTPGSCGQITITVNNPPSISSQPAASTTLCAGSTLNLSVTAANGTGYQWYKNSNPISGATSSSYSIPVTTTTDAGTYYVVVTGQSPCANLQSNNAVVTINPPINVTTQPAATSNICDGSPLNLSITASNTTSYQWYLNGNLITGATSSTYNVPAASTADAGTYYVAMGAQTSCSPANSNNAVVNIITRPTATPGVNGASTVCDGTPTNIDIALTGTGPWTFDYYDGTNTVNVNTGSTPYSFSVMPSTTTTYSITSLMDMNCTSISSDYSGTATVSVDPRPTATLSNSGPATICNGNSTNVDINFTGTGPWDFTYFDGTSSTPVTGYASNVYTLSVNPTTTTTYSVTALNDANCTAIGADMMSTATVTVENSPSIVSPPTAATACSGVGTSLTVLATGDGLMYQWLYNGSPISDNSTYTGTQTNTLSISSVTSVGGSYEVQISGNCPPMVTTTAVNVTEDMNNTWDGSTSTAWSDPSNWSCGTVPIVTTNVLIPTGATNMPLVDIPTAICNSLTIQPSASVMFTGSNNVLELKAGITNNGTFDPSGGRITLSGAGMQNIPAVTYGNLFIDGGSVKTLDGNATVSGILNLVSGHILLGANDLTLDVPVQTLGGSSSSYVITNSTGQIIGRNMGVGGNPDAAVFHVGINASSYTPIMLENLGASDNFSVRVMPNVYDDGYGVLPGTVSNPVVNRTWMVDEATAGGSIVNMTPYWNAVDEINGFVQTNVYVAHYLGGMWIGYTTTASAAPPAGTWGSLFSAYADSIQSFSPFTVASAGQFPLSSKLDKITAINIGARNRVDWTTASEITGDKFEIQRSADGKTFASIGNTDAKGTPSSYTYWDASPIQGKNYYRVKMTDVNGKSFYTSVVSTTMNGSGSFSISAHPNPVSGTLTVVANGTMSDNARIVITDVTGAVVKTMSVQDNISNINVSALANGVYFVKYSDSRHQETIKINKQ